MERNTIIKFNILAILCILIFCFAITPIGFQNDTYYTIKIGEHIVQTGQVDMQDPFSWHEDLPYTYPHWAYDVGTYLTYQLGESIGIGGFTAVYILTVLLSMTLGVVVYLAVTKLSKNHVLSFLITLGMIYLLKDFIAARAQLVTFILFALTILFIEQFIATKKKRYAVYLVIIPIIIANVHCAVWPFYFVLFIPYIVEYILAAIADSNFIYNMQIRKVEKKLRKATKATHQPDKIEALTAKLKKLQQDKQTVDDKVKKRREEPYRIIFRKEPAVKWLIVVVLICLLTGFLTPLGTTPYTYFVKTMQGNTTQNINEHQPLTLINNMPILITFTLFLLILIFTDTKIKLRDMFMLAGLVLLTFMSRRQASIFVLICGMIFAKMVVALLEKYDKNGTKTVMMFMNTITGKVLTILIILLISMVMYKDKMNDKFVNTASYPVDASTYILENIDIDNMKLFNEYNYGSYLLFRGIPVFIDSRADLYAPEFNGTKNAEGKYDGRDIFSDYINTSNIGNYYEDKMEEYDITHVILGTRAKLTMFLSRDTVHYKEIYSDDNFVIYERLTD